MEEKLRKKLIALYNKKAAGNGILNLLKPKPRYGQGCGGRRKKMVEYVPAHMSHSKKGKQEHVRGYYRDEPIAVRHHGMGRVKVHKRAPSEYNMFVGKLMKQGYTMKEAAEQYRMHYDMHHGIEGHGRKRKMTKRGKGILKFLL
jgi:hypothetical protein